MTANANSNSQQLDDQLAEFVDRLLEDEASQGLEMQVQDQELLELFDTAMRIKRAFGDEGLDRSTALRIKAKLVSEWRRCGYSRKRNSIWQRFFSRRTGWKSATGRQRKYGVIFAVAIILFLIIAYPLITSAGPNLTGAADGQINLVPILLVFVLGVGIAYWLIRSR